MGKSYYGFIYLWENLHPEANKHRKYIGQHAGDTEDGYIGSGSIFLKRYYSKKYRGFWRRSVLQYCNTLDELNAAEIQIIKAHNAQVDSQYCNVRGGGDSGGTCSNGYKQKMSRYFKNHSRIPWNKGKKGEYKQSQQAILNRINARTSNMSKLYEKDNKQILRHIKQHGWIKATEISKILNRSCSASVYKKRIKILIEQNKIKMYTFGYNDVRYVPPNFTFENIVLNIIANNKEQTVNDICIKLCNQFNINNGKYKVQGILQQLQKQNKIKQYRGYRKNYYCLFDNCAISNYNPYTI